MSSKIIVLCGPIASGKSTYCKNAALNGNIIVNDDSIVNMLHANNYRLYDKNLKILYKSVENLIISMSLSMGRTVVVDRGLNIGVQGRQRWIALARSFDVPCEAVVFENQGPDVHAQRRMKHDGRGYDFDYWYRVANVHQEQYRHPSVEEGFSAVHSISYSEIMCGKII